jgi:hypothetical protein
MVAGKSLPATANRAAIVALLVCERERERERGGKERRQGGERAARRFKCLSHANRIDVT